MTVLTADTWVHARVIPCGIYGGHIGTGQDFSPSSSVFRCQYHSTVDLHTQISSGGVKNRPLRVCSSETWSHPVDVNVNKKR
jgi:hypothetical protein